MIYPLKQAWRLVESLGLFSAQSPQTLAFQIEQHARERPDKTFLLFENQRFSYAEANARINQHAHAHRTLGIGKGDVVALILDNRPEFLWHMFALHKLGAIASLINSQLQGEPLAHAVRICKPRHVVVGREVWAEFQAIRSALPELSDLALSIDYEALPPTLSEPRAWSERLHGCSSADPPHLSDNTLSDQAAFIYTSGTTGLPKAAIVRHNRMFRAGRLWAGLVFCYAADDVLYCCLPLYHSNAALLGVGSVISSGATLALARKFSRSTFWRDVRRFNATGFIYIGELCRYLMNGEPSPDDRQHRLRVISGNGLRRDVWGRFQRRFGIPRIVEFYGATEGNCVTLNVFSLRGSVGPMLPYMTLARWDDDQGTFVRDARGHLVRANPGEPGVLLGRIRSPASFEGYEDERATQDKIVRNAFEPGDAWFNTGDLLRRDALWHLYFVDRLGDTYRWKGENVATSEVETQLARWPGVREVNVYGVEVPGMEGRAGMAALVLAPDRVFDPAGLRKYVDERLPPYAWPRLVRVMPELRTTATFKVKKRELQHEGYAAELVREPLYLLDPTEDAYIELTPALRDALARGQLKL